MKSYEGKRERERGGDERKRKDVTMVGQRRKREKTVCVSYEVARVERERVISVLSVKDYREPARL